MTAPNFKETYRNPFSELSELRFELSASSEDKFELNCRMRFSVMHYEYNGRQYRVGLERAMLRLNLEGCKTTFDPVFGECQMAAVTDETRLEVGCQANGKVKAQVGTDSLPSGSLGVEAGMGVSRGRNSSQTETRLPVTAKPNDAWLVAAQSVDGTAQSSLNGTAIAGQRLCTVKRSDGGNRLAIAGEIHASKAALNVTAHGGNLLGRDFAIWNNKDAIVGQILKRALGRENGRPSSSVIVVSLCEVAEE